MPGRCSAPHCRRTLSCQERAAACSVCAQEVHERCQQHLATQVGAFKICFYCSLSPEVTLKKVEQLHNYFVEKVEKRKKKKENGQTQNESNHSTNNTNSHIIKPIVAKERDGTSNKHATHENLESNEHVVHYETKNSIDCPDGKIQEVFHDAKCEGETGRRGKPEERNVQHDVARVLESIKMQNQLLESVIAKTDVMRNKNSKSDCRII